MFAHFVLTSDERRMTLAQCRPNECVLIKGVGRLGAFRAVAWATGIRLRFFRYYLFFLGAFDSAGNLLLNINYIYTVKSSRSGFAYETWWSAPQNSHGDSGYLCRESKQTKPNKHHVWNMYRLCGLHWKSAIFNETSLPTTYFDIK